MKILTHILTFSAAGRLIICLFITSALRLPAQIEVVSGGNVGIGTASPGSKLDVNGTANVTGATTLGSTLSLNYANPRYEWYNTGAGTNEKRWDILVTGAAMNFRLINDGNTAANNWLTVNRSGYASATTGFSGNVVIGGTSGNGNRLEVYSSAQAPAVFYNDTYYYTTFVGNAATNSVTGISFGTRDGGGTLKVGYITQDSSGNMFLLTLGNVGVQVTSTQGIRFPAYGAGTLTTDSSGNITATSDARAKDTVADFTTGLAAIRQLQPKKYHWKKATGLNTDDLNVSVYAQDLIAAGIPEAVFTQRTVEEQEEVSVNGVIQKRQKLNAQGEPLLKKMDANYYTVSDRAVISVLINAVKELAAESDALKTRLAALEASGK